jgi:hypothetical protein
MIYPNQLFDFEEPWFFIAKPVLCFFNNHGYISNMVLWIFLKTTFINTRNPHGNTRGLFQFPDNRPARVFCTTRLLELVVWFLRTMVIFQSLFGWWSQNLTFGYFLTAKFSPNFNLCDIFPWKKWLKFSKFPKNWKLPNFNKLKGFVFSWEIS